MNAPSRRLDVLDFERPIAERESRLEVLRATAGGSEGIEAVRRLEAEIREETAAIFSNLSPWQVAQVARHPQRPYTLDYVERMCSTFVELHGDRAFADDRAMVGGLARLEGRALVVVGHQKGRDTREKVQRQFGMPNPEGYRKALRLLKLAERFRLPVLSLIDTPGAYPGIGAEERGQSEAIARNLVEMARLRTPIVCAVIGEGGSGGALAIGVGDRVLMLEHSVYSVISPEGCASILWKKAEEAARAAEAMGIDSKRLYELGLIDRILEEPLGGAHRDPDTMAARLAAAVSEELAELEGMDPETLIARRYERLMGHGVFA